MDAPIQAVVRCPLEVAGAYDCFQDLSEGSSVENTMKVIFAVLIFSCCSQSVLAQEMGLLPRAEDIATVISSELSRQAERSLPVLSARIDVVDAKALKHDCSLVSPGLVDCMASGSFDGFLYLDGSATSVAPRAFDVRQKLRLSMIEGAGALVDGEEV